MKKKEIPQFVQKYIKDQSDTEAANFIKNEIERIKSDIERSKLDLERLEKIYAEYWCIHNFLIDREEEKDWFINTTYKCSKCGIIEIETLFWL